METVRSAQGKRSTQTELQFRLALRPRTSKSGRFTLSKDLAESDVWWNGPEFSLKSQNEWPSENPSTGNGHDADEEAIKSPPNVTHIMVNKDTTLGSRREWTK